MNASLLVTLNFKKLQILTQGLKYSTCAMHFIAT